MRVGCVCLGCVPGVEFATLKILGGRELNRMREKAIDITLVTLTIYATCSIHAGHE